MATLVSHIFLYNERRCECIVDYVLSLMVDPLNILPVGLMTIIYQNLNVSMYRCIAQIATVSYEEHKREP